MFQPDREELGAIAHSVNVGWTDAATRVTMPVQVVQRFAKCHGEFGDGVRVERTTGESTREILIGRLANTVDHAGSVADRGAALIDVQQSRMGQFPDCGPDLQAILCDRAVDR